MKSREEYQASIFKKRDALLKKRKKNIAASVTAFAAIAFLTVSVAAIPSLTKNQPSKNETVNLTSTSAVNENYITQQSSDYDNLNEGEEYTTEQDCIPPETIEAAAEASPEDFEFATNIAMNPITKKHPDDGQTDNIPFDAVDEMFSLIDGLNNEETEDEAIREYSEKEIAETAYSHLSTIQKAKCIDKDNPRIMSVTSSSWSAYYVTFSTSENNSYQVILRQSNLEFIETVILSEKETSKESESVTLRDGYKGELN